MAEGKDIAWTQIGITAGVGIACLALGVFVVAPAIQKFKAKKAAKKAQDGKQTADKK